MGPWCNGTRSGTIRNSLKFLTHLRDLSYLQKNSKKTSSVLLEIHYIKKLITFKDESLSVCCQTQ